MNGWVLFWIGTFVLNLVFVVVGDIPLVNAITCSLSAIMAGIYWDKNRA